MKSTSTLFDRIISRPRSPWVMLIIALILFFAPFAAAYADGVSTKILSGPQWRGLLVPAAVILYILLSAPRLNRTENQIIESLRPIILVNDDTFEQIVDEAASIQPRNEIVAIVLGVVIGLLMIARSFEPSLSWLSLEFYLSSVLMYGLITWTIYVSIAGTRLSSSLLRQPLHVDPLDIAAFEPIGRQSLILALVFIGGITLSLVFVAIEAETIFLHLEFWLIYVPLALVPVVLFFLNMVPTHRVLATAKARELAAVRYHLHRSFREFLTDLDAQHPTNDLSSQISALSAYENKLQNARTWPYNTGMLRTLFFSILVPAAAVLGRIIAEVMFD